MKHVAIITSYFNPAGFKIKRENYFQFRKQFENEGIFLLTLEQVTKNSDLSNLKNVISIQGGAILWQKERLLNLGISHLSKEYKFIFWMDCDILFENLNWIEASVVKLQNTPVLQPFSKVYRLPKDIKQAQEIGESWNSFGFVYKQNTDLLLSGNFDLHGHTGFAWAANREVLKFGLYDRCILGSADHMMAHAFVGDWESPCIVRILGRMNPILKDFQTWAKKVYSITQAQIDYVENKIFHLWHGNEVNRKYVSRNKMLVKMGFSPNQDLKLGKNGLWEWKTKNQALMEFCKNYFYERKEEN